MVFLTCMKEELEETAQEHPAFSRGSTDGGSDVDSESSAPTQRASRLLDFSGVVDLPYRLIPSTLKAVVELSSLTDPLPVIGEGRHGTVLLACLRGDLVALKFVNPQEKGRIEPWRTSEYWEEGVLEGFASLQNEYRVLERLRHRNVVPLLGKVVEESEDGPSIAGIILPFYPEGDLATYMEARGGCLPLNVTLKLAIGIFEGLAYLHGLGYAHFDVKPENILVKDTLGELTASITDFGYAVKKRSAMAGFCVRRPIGTEGYMAPEMPVTYSQAGTAADVFAAGLTVIAMLVGNVPYNDSWPENVAGHRLRSLEKLTGLPTEFTDIVKECLKIGPSWRPDCQTVVTALRAVQQEVAHAQAANCGWST